MTRCILASAAGLLLTAFVACGDGAGSGEPSTSTAGGADPSSTQSAAATPAVARLPEVRYYAISDK